MMLVLLVMMIAVRAFLLAAVFRLAALAAGLRSMIVSVMAIAANVFLLLFFGLRRFT
jgi:hypothetical protein